MSQLFQTWLIKENAVLQLNHKISHEPMWVSDPSGPTNHSLDLLNWTENIQSATFKIRAPPGYFEHLSRLFLSLIVI